MIIFDLERYESATESRLIPIILGNKRITVECLEGIDLLKIKVAKWSNKDLAYGNDNLAGSLRVNLSYGLKPESKDHVKFSSLLRDLISHSDFAKIPLVYRFLIEYLLGFCAISDNANHLGIKPIDPDRIEETIASFVNATLTRSDNRYDRDQVKTVSHSLRMIDSLDSVKLAVLIDRALLGTIPVKPIDPIVSNAGNNSDPVTIETRASLRQELKDLGVSYRSKAKLDELRYLRDQALDRLTNPDPVKTIDPGLNDPIDPTI